MKEPLLAWLDWLDHTENTGACHECLNGEFCPVETELRQKAAELTRELKLKGVE